MKLAPALALIASLLLGSAVPFPASADSGPDSALESGSEAAAAQEGPSEIESGVKVPTALGELELLPIATSLVEIPEARSVIRATDTTAGVAEALAKTLAQDRAEIEDLLGLSDHRTIELRIGHGRIEFGALQPGGRRVPGWAAGVAYPSLGIIVLDTLSTGRSGNHRTVLRHELAHVALGGLTDWVPKWFTEGFALHAAGEWSMSRSSRLGRAAVSGSLIPLSDIERNWPTSLVDVDLAYAQSASMVAFLARQRDGRLLPELARRLATGEDFQTALREAAGKPLAVLEAEWKKSLRTRYGWIPLLLDQEILWVAAALLLVYAAWRRRRSNKRRIAEYPDEFDDLPFEAYEPFGPTHEPYGPHPDTYRTLGEEPSDDEDEDSRPPGGWLH